MPKRDRNAKREEELQKSAAKCQRLDTIFRRSLNDSLPEIPTMPPGNYDPSAAITPDDTPKDKGVPPVIEILPSSCSRPSTVPELCIWKSNLLGLVRFFRTPRRMKMLSAQAGNVKHFPGTTMSGLPSTSCSWWMLC